MNTDRHQAGPMGILLGSTLDRLLNRDWREKEEDPNRNWGIRLPTEKDPGSGNIVICGRTGSGKSTLAMQIAVACTRPQNGLTAAYVSLEETVENVFTKAGAFGWKPRLQEVRHLHALDESAPPDELADILQEIFLQPDECDLRKGPGETLTCPQVECKELGERLEACRSQEPSGEAQPAPQPIPARVLVLSLSPRSLSPAAGGTSLFQERFAQLERLVVAARTMNRGGSNRAVWPQLRLVCIDSLNMFGERMLDREEMYRLFNLFRQNQIIGLFTVESSQRTPFDSTLADVVIRLTARKEQGYFVRYLEIEKSRYVEQVPGIHPFKILSRPEDRDDKQKLSPEGGGTGTPPVPPSAPADGGQTQGTPLGPGPELATTDVPLSTKTPEHDAKEAGIPSDTGVVVYPSLHWRVSTTKAKPPRMPPGDEQDGNGDESDEFDFGAEGFKDILPGTLRRGGVVTLEGERGTFKTTFAVNFLAAGLRKGESALLIHFGERSILRSVYRTVAPTVAPTVDPTVDPTQKYHPEPHRISGELARPCGEAKQPYFEWKRIGVKEDDAERASWTRLAGETKADIHVWSNTYAPPPDKKGYTRPANSRLVEVDFKSGMLLPEEFVSIVLAIMEEFENKRIDRIRRVVLDDVSLIGVSYPFLRESSTTGQFFLSAFVHIMRNHGVDLVINGTKGDLPEVNESVQRAVSLADAVISSRYCNVFGQRSVVVRSEGLMVGRQQQRVSTVESVPALVRWHMDQPRTFDLDFDHLEGLVGFESGDIHRPGLLLYLFNEYIDNPKSVQSTYNQSLETLIMSAFGRPYGSLAEADSRLGTKSDVSVVRFGSNDSEAIHDSLTVLRGGPLDHTVIYSVDEFWAAPAEEGKRSPEERYLTSGREEGESQQNPLPKYIVHLENSDEVEPYYGNVLLLAFRKDIPPVEESYRPEQALPINEAKAEQEATDWVRGVLDAISRSGAEIELPSFAPPESWRQIRRLAEVLQHARGRAALAPPGPAFCFDQSARETLACALMDALVAGRYPDDVRNIRSIAGNFPEGFDEKHFRDPHRNLCGKFFDDLCPNKEGVLGRIEEGQFTEVCHLSDLFHLPGSDAAQQYDPVEDAAVYLCWYSQLRDLIARRPALAERLAVCPLPGGGFTGDWFVGIARGSVSIGLGRKMLNLLCSREEEYKRFAQGVGLPTRTEFYLPSAAEKQRGQTSPEFFAWPRGQAVKVRKILDMHLQALSRSFIPSYTRFRSALATVAFQLTPMSGPYPSDAVRRIVIKENVGRLPEQIRMLSGAP